MESPPKKRRKHQKEISESRQLHGNSQPLDVNKVIDKNTKYIYVEGAPVASCSKLNVVADEPSNSVQHCPKLRDTEENDGDDLAKSVPVASCSKVSVVEEETGNSVQLDNSDSNSASSSDDDSNSTSSESDSNDDTDSNSSSFICDKLSDLDEAMLDIQKKSDDVETLAKSVTHTTQLGATFKIRRRHRHRKIRRGKSVEIFESLQQNDKFNLNDLPSFVLVKIFGYLPLHVLLLRVAVVCRHWYELSTDSALWRHLDLKGQLRASDEVLLRLTRYSNRVISVDISSVQWITSKGLTRMLQQCRHLETLKINWPSSIIGDESLGKIGELCPNLRYLSLSSAYMLSDESVKKIAHGCPALTHLAIGHCQLVSDDGVVAVAENCPKLQFLLLDKCVRISEDSVEALASGCPDLTTLSLMGCRKLRTGLHIKKLKKLRSLDISQINDFDVTSLQDIVCSCDNLQRLNMSLIRTLTDEDIKYLAAKLTNLQYLHLVGCKLTDRSMHHLGNLAHRTLVHLDVGWCEGVSDEGVCFIVERCRALRYLGLIRCDSVTMVTLRELMMCYPSVQFSNFHLDCERLLWEYRLMENT